ncbi:hypothetical protein IWQ60_011511 [Tieghemiomyces parasiticus]|uniref:Metallo-beta-lactamase domain-containing protein n=1 Tax=Tieghemiomyces parasiticus TaxID=78921 RepID=A0A9W8DH79_9FUNG|nr:hypothetical protein IWQ60_011511 [Tieghemiomyces parasiticus]
MANRQKAVESGGKSATDSKDDVADLGLYTDPVELSHADLQPLTVTDSDIPLDTRADGAGPTQAVYVTSPALYTIPGIPLELQAMYIQGRFVNPFPNWRDKTLYDFFRWRWTRTGGNGLPTAPESLADALPVEVPDWKVLRNPERLLPMALCGNKGNGMTTLKSPSPKPLDPTDPAGMEASWVMNFSTHPDGPKASPSPLFPPATTARQRRSDDHPRPKLNTSPAMPSSSSPNLTVTWLGQSTCYVQLPGLNILTDPIFQPRTVTSWLGPKRLRPVPCTLDQLAVDVVLVSHNHYDHLEWACVEQLGDSVLWFVPLGMRQWFTRHGIRRVVEMNWWQFCDLRVVTRRPSAEPGSEPVVMVHRFRVAATPAQHWSGRGLLDSNRSLWCGWFVRRLASQVVDPLSLDISAERTIAVDPAVDLTTPFLVDPTAPDLGSFYHCGDTGYYAPLFRTIRQHLGPVTLAALPIGSYLPRWYMCHQHINPDDAVLIHRDVAATRSIGVHWATFMMSDEDYLAPPRDLRRALEFHDLPVAQFVTPSIGLTLTIAIDSS